MACSSCFQTTDQFGANPTNIQWSVVRGDTATLRVQFFQEDEATAYTTTTWVYKSTAYDPVTKTSYVLDVSSAAGYVDIIAQPTKTKLWGAGYQDKVAELNFDLQVTIPSAGSGNADTVWTPVIGTISVLADITPWSA